MRASIASVVLVVALAVHLGAGSSQSDTPRPSAGTKAAAPVSEERDVQAFAIGAFPATALRDGALEFPNDNRTFGVGRTREEVAELLTAAGLPADDLQLSIQPLLVETPGRVLLFDTGAGANMGSNGGRLLTSMAAAGIDPLRADLARGVQNLERRQPRR